MYEVMFTAWWTFCTVFIVALAVLIVLGVIAAVVASVMGVLGVDRMEIRDWLDRWRLKRRLARAKRRKDKAAEEDAEAALRDFAPRYGRCSKPAGHRERSDW